MFDFVTADYYRQFAGVTLVCLGDAQWYAYDYNLIYSRSTPPMRLGDLIPLPNPKLTEYATQQIPFKATIVRRAGTVYFNAMTTCLLSKCPDSQLDYRNPAPYQNTFTVRAIYGMQGLEGVARSLGGSMDYTCFPGYKFLDGRSSQCARICHQPEGVYDLRVLFWILADSSPAYCPFVAVACAPANCPAFTGFFGSIMYADTWNPNRLRYFGADLAHNPNKPASDGDNQVNAMYDIYDKDWDYTKHPETSSCLGRWVGDNPSPAADPGMFPPDPKGIGWPLCKQEPAATTANIVDTYVCSCMVSQGD